MNTQNFSVTKDQTDFILKNKNRLSQTAIAKEIGVSQSWVHRFLKGKEEKKDVFDVDRFWKEYYNY